MDIFVPIPYHEVLSLNYFLQKNLGLHTLQKQTAEQSTQTDTPTMEQSTQTKKPQSLLWGYFS